MTKTAPRDLFALIHSVCPLEVPQNGSSLTHVPCGSPNRGIQRPPGSHRSPGRLVLSHAGISNHKKVKSWREMSLNATMQVPQRCHTRGVSDASLTVVHAWTAMLSTSQATSLRSAAAEQHAKDRREALEALDQQRKEKLDKLRQQQAKQRANMMEALKQEVLREPTLPDAALHDERQCRSNFMPNDSVQPPKGPCVRAVGPGAMVSGSLAAHAVPSGRSQQAEPGSSTASKAANPRLPETAVFVTQELGAVHATATEPHISSQSASRAVAGEGHRINPGEPTVHTLHAFHGTEAVPTELSQLKHNAPSATASLSALQDAALTPLLDSLQNPPHPPLHGLQSEELLQRGVKGGVTAPAPPLDTSDSSPSRPWYNTPTSGSQPQVNPVGAGSDQPLPATVHVPSTRSIAFGLAKAAAGAAHTSADPNQQVARPTKQHPATAKITLGGPPVSAGQGSLGGLRSGVSGPEATRKPGVSPAPGATTHGGVVASPATGAPQRPPRDSQEVAKLHEFMQRRRQQIEEQQQRKHQEQRAAAMRQQEASRQYGQQQREVRNGCVLPLWLRKLLAAGWPQVVVFLMY